jgi:hypothetical protein
MSAGGGIDRGKIGIIISNNLQKRRKEKPSYDERSSTGKTGCGKSARYAFAMLRRHRPV